MSLIEVNCSFCSRVITRSSDEIKRRLKYESNYFCSRECSGKFTSKEKKTSGRKDQLSPFRKFLSRANSRKIRKDLEVSLTLEDLKEVWESQRGICPYLQVVLHLGETNNPNLQASLDRIDSSKGYVRGNIQFISRTLNYAKSSYSEENLRNLFQLIKKSSWGCQDFDRATSK